MANNGSFTNIKHLKVGDNDINEIYYFLKMNEVLVKDRVKLQETKSNLMHLQAKPI